MCKQWCLETWELILVQGCSSLAIPALVKRNCMGSTLSMHRFATIQNYATWGSNSFVKSSLQACSASRPNTHGEMDFFLLQKSGMSSWLPYISCANFWPCSCLTGRRCCCRHPNSWGHRYNETGSARCIQGAAWKLQHTWVALQGNDGMEASWEYCPWHVFDFKSAILSCACIGVSLGSLSPTSTLITSSHDRYISIITKIRVLVLFHLNWCIVTIADMWYCRILSLQCKRADSGCSNAVQASVQVLGLWRLLLTWFWRTWLISMLQSRKLNHNIWISFCIPRSDMI